MRFDCRGLFLIPVLVVLAHPFRLDGVWKPIRSPGQRFEVRTDKVSSFSDQGSSISMDYEWEEGDVMRLSHLVIHRKPHDWYNMRKYTKYIRYLSKAKAHGILVRIQVIDPDQIRIMATIGGEDLPEFLLIRSSDES